MQRGIHPVRKPTRLAHFDYANCGIYFVTICAQHRETRFGDIIDGEVCLNRAGIMVAEMWETNAGRYTDVALDQFVVMPDHLHAILFLGTNARRETATESLNTIIGSFKSLTTLEYATGVHSGIYPPFDRVLWQRSFHDRIIRNQRDLDIARRYIENNPFNSDSTNNQS